MRKLLIALSLAALAGSPAFAAAPCKDAKGKFIKCPPPAAAPAKPAMTAKTTTSVKTTNVKTTKVQRCRNAKGQFAKCGTPGAKPV
jgi:hypothetical protein